MPFHPPNTGHQDLKTVRRDSSSTIRGKQGPRGHRLPERWFAKIGCLIRQIVSPDRGYPLEWTWDCIWVKEWSNFVDEEGIFKDIIPAAKG